MSHSTRRIILGVVAALTGVGLGLLIGWYVWPVTYTEATPARMRQDWKDETVWLAAEAFAYDHDLDAAQARLRPLGSKDLGAVVLERTEKAIQQNLAVRYVINLARLAAALGAHSARTDPYLNP